MGKEKPQQKKDLGLYNSPIYDDLALIPYFYSNDWKVASQDSTLMRGLIFDFPSDKEVFNIGDQYMFGPSILGNPVTDSVETTHKLYFSKIGVVRFLDR